MIITPTNKTRRLISDYDNAPVLGNSYECFLTGQKVGFGDYRVLKINTHEGLKTYKIYLNPMYHTMCRGSIPYIEQKILNEAK